MSVHNGAAHLRAAIDSVLGQTDGDFEFLIVNDGSTDETSEILAAYLKIDSRIRVFEQPNRGLIAGLNRLIDESRAPLIARMDADDICLPERFARQKAFLDSHPAYGVVGTWTYDLRPHHRSASPSMCHQPTSHAEFEKAIDRGTALLCHPSAMMRRSILMDVGGYRPSFRHCEDYDLWLRLAGLTQLCSLPERLIIYRYSETQVSSQHILEQAINAAAARLAYEARQKGLPDPFSAGQAVPPLSDFDTFFGQPGASKIARQRMTPHLLHSPIALRGPGFGVILDHATESAPTIDLWRTTLRLLRLGEVSRAAQLARALACN